MSSLVCLMGVLPLVEVPALKANAASDVNVNLASQGQVIKGFGGMNHPIWTSDLTSGQRDTAFGNSTNQLGLSILRIHIDENRNNWSRELATAKAAQAKGATIFATPWNPPASMTEPITKNGKRTKRLKNSSYGAYAQYLNEFVQYMKNNGVNLYAISFQNEPDWGFEWTWWEPDEIYNFTKYYAGSIKGCKVMSAESFSYNKNYYNKILNDQSALNNIDIVATHFYGTQVKDMAYPLLKQKASSKELWMTEVYVPNSDANSADRWPEALDVSLNMHNALNNGFQAYTWWYIRRSYSLIKEDGNISKRGYCFANYSKFVRPGYVKVDATVNPDNGIYVTAYKGDNKAVIVAINKSNAQVTKKFNVSNGTIKSVDRYRTSANENLAKTANMELTGNGFYASLPANTVSTFVCSLSGSGNSTTQPTEPSNPTQTVPGSTAKLADGWYYIKNVNAQKYLQVTGNTAKAATNVELRTGNGANGQKWYLKNLSDGYVTLTSALGEFMLDVASAKNTDGANIQIYNAHSGNAQQFMLKTSSTNGAYVIATKCSNLTKVLDDYEFRKEDGTNVCQWTYGGKANQQWKFEPVQSGTTTPSNPTTPSNGKLKLDYTINNWGSGYQVNFKISNNTSANVNGWTLKIKKSDINISSSWNVTVNQSGDYYVITPVSYNAYIAKGASIEFGIQGSGSIGNTISYTLS